MAARSLSSMLLSLTRNRWREKTLTFSRFFSSSASRTENLCEEYPSNSNHSDDGTGTGVEDLKRRIFSLRLPKRSATNVLHNWVAQGNQLSISDLRRISSDLYKSRRYKHALEISEWMVAHEEFELSDSDYATRIDLMTKVFGIDSAERYFEALPLNAKTSETYTALLHCYAGARLIERAEKLYERIKESNLSSSALMYNELMTLYLSVGQVEKVSSVVEELKRQKIAPDIFTYNLWISSCAAALNMDEVGRILDEMSHDSSSNAQWVRYVNLARIYLNSSHLVNSESNAVIESENSITQREWISYDFLIILYGGLGNKDKLNQIWKSLIMTKQRMTSRNYLCILSSYLMLEHMKEVGEVVDQWKQSTVTEFDVSSCNRLLKAFADIGMMEKAASFHTLLAKKGFNLIYEFQ